MNSNAAILGAARNYLGLKEYPGARSNPAVEQFFARAGYPGLTDDVPWCAAFVGAVLAECGVQPSGSLMARSYLKWGTDVPTREARPGDVVVFSRGQPPAGHVAFFLSWAGSRVNVLGGNQGDAVTETSYPVEAVLGVRRADMAAQDGSDVRTIRSGSAGALVFDLQEQLVRLGYFSGRLDGRFGPRTRAAVLGFQADHDLETDGIVGPQTWAAIKAAVPRDRRDVTMTDLRVGRDTMPSRIVRAGDLTQSAAGIGVVTTALTTVADTISEVQGTVGQAVGVLPVLRTLVADNWPLLVLLVLFVAVMIYAQQAKRARLDDAQSGANVAP